jgi:hypothetical protein
MYFEDLWWCSIRFNSLTFDPLVRFAISLDPARRISSGPLTSGQHWQSLLKYSFIIVPYLNLSTTATNAALACALVILMGVFHCFVSFSENELIKKLSKASLLV